MKQNSLTRKPLAVRLAWASLLVALIMLVLSAANAQRDGDLPQESEQIETVEQVAPSTADSPALEDGAPAAVADAPAVTADAPAVTAEEDATPDETVTVEIPTNISRWTELIPIAIAVLSPLLLGWLKRVLIVRRVDKNGVVVKELPTWFPKWLPLILGPLLIWLADFLVRWLAGAPGIDPYVLLLLSPLPTWLRELGDQYKKFRKGAATQVVDVEFPNGIEGV